VAAAAAVTNNVSATAPMPTGLLPSIEYVNGGYGVKNPLLQSIHSPREMDIIRS
jgi:hypothetical protein